MRGDTGRVRSMAQVTGSSTEFDDGVIIPRRVRMANEITFVWHRRNDAPFQSSLRELRCATLSALCIQFIHMPLFSSRYVDNLGPKPILD